MIVDTRRPGRQPAGRDTSTLSPGYQQAAAEARAAQEAAAQITAAFPDPSKPIFVRMLKTGARLEVGFETALHILVRGDGELTK